MSERKSFLEVTRDVVAISNSLEVLAAESGGEITPHFEAEVSKLLAVHELHGHKADAVGAVRNRFRAVSADICKRAAEMKKVGESLAKAADHLDYKLLMAMEILGQNEIEGVDMRFRRVKNPGRLVIQDESRIPDAYKRTIQTVEIDKAQIKQDLLDGAPVDGCDIETGFSLRTYPATGAIVLKRRGE